MTERLDLGVRRDFGEIFGTAVELFRRHFLIFFPLTLLVVGPAVVVVEGVWGDQLSEGSEADIEAGPVLASGLVFALVIPAFVTALHVSVVQRLGAGESPGLRDALALVMARVLPAAGAVALYFVCVVGGFVLLIIPGIWLSIRFYFAAQMAVVEGVSPVEALRRSSSLVKGDWWRVFGYLLLAGIILGLLTAIVDALIANLDAAPYVVASALLQSLALSLSALFGTLLFFDLRARKGPGPGLVPEDLVAPERPVA